MGGGGRRFGGGGKGFFVSGGGAVDGGPGSPRGSAGSSAKPMTGGGSPGLVAPPDFAANFLGAGAAVRRDGGSLSGETDLNGLALGLGLGATAPAPRGDKQQAEQGRGVSTALYSAPPGLAHTLGICVPVPLCLPACRPRIGTNHGQQTANHAATHEAICITLAEGRVPRTALSVCLAGPAGCGSVPPTASKLQPRGD